MRWFRDKPRRLGWLVTMSCFVMYTVSFSTMYGFSLLMKELFDEFGCRISTAGYVGCVMSASAYLTSPFTAFLLTKLSHRSVCIIGVLFCAIGTFTSSFVPSIYYLFLTLGICHGVGVNFIFHSSLCLQLQYFPTKSERPVTLSFSGFSAAWMVSVPLLHYFVKTYGWRIGLQMISAVILAVCIIACVPLCPSKLKEEKDNENKEKTKCLRDNKQDDSCRYKELKRSQVDSDKCDMKVFLLKPETWMFSAGMITAMASWSFFYINIVSFLRSDDTTGLSESEAATIVFMCGFGEVAGKIVLLAVAGILQSIPSIYVAAFGNALSAILTIGVLLCSSFTPVATFVILASFVRTIWHTYPITGGVEELKNADGVSTVYFISLGFGYLLGALIVGELYNLTGSYEVPMLLVAGIFIISGLFYAFVPLIRYIRTKKLRKPDGYSSVCIDNDSKDSTGKRKLSRKYSEAEGLKQYDVDENRSRTISVDEGRLVVERRVSTV